MSLRDFIRAAAQDVRAKLKPAPEAGETAVAEGAEKNREMGETRPKKKEKKVARPIGEEDRGQKRRRKEQAQKTRHEERPEESGTPVRQVSPVVIKEGPVGETELPETPSAGLGRFISVPFVEAEDVEGNAEQAGKSSGPAMYQPQWPNILEDSILNEPRLRAEWVARSLPPSELRAYAWADTFDVCDIANRAAILSTLAANGMQRLLCAKDREIDQLREENAEAKAAVKKADGLVADALRRERNLEKEMERLRSEVYEMPSLKTQLEEAQASVARMQAEMVQQIAQGAEKDKEIETLIEGKLKSAQDLAAATGELFSERQTHRYLMTSGIEEILMKVRTSDEYGKFVGGLVPKIQALGKSDLIKKMRHDYFPDVRPEEIPYFEPNAEAEAEVAFQQLRSAPFECQILAQLAANLDMNEEEIRNLQNPKLIVGTGSMIQD